MGFDDVDKRFRPKDNIIRLECVLCGTDKDVEMCWPCWPGAYKSEALCKSCCWSVFPPKN